MNTPRQAQKRPTSKRWSRRAFLRRIGLAGAGAGLLGGVYAGLVEPVWADVVRHEMDVPGLDAALEGLRIVQISDLHISSWVPVSYLRREMDRCTSLSPDAIVITGDFLTQGQTVYLPELQALLRRLHAPFGVYAVLGNHDYYDFLHRLPNGKRRARPIVNEVTAALADCGLTVLRNQCQVLEVGGGRLQIVGVDDLKSGRFHPDQAFAEVDSTLPCIALSHNPDTIFRLTDQPCSWVLCGHTHGGQVRLPLLGPLFLPVKHREFAAGLFDVNGTRLYVNRGLGYLYRVRFNCRPEITEFTLVRRL